MAKSVNHNFRGKAYVTSLVTTSIIAIASYAPQAHAQAFGGIVTATRPILDKRGVDVRTGQVKATKTSISALDLSFDPSQFSDTAFSTLNAYIASSGSDLVAVINGKSLRFISNGSGGYNAEAGAGYSLVPIGASGSNNYDLTLPDGTIVHFYSHIGTGDKNIPLTIKSYAHQVVFPDGRKQDYYYKTKSVFISGRGSGHYNVYSRVQSIVSSSGTMLKAEYSSSDVQLGALNKVSLINLSDDYCDPNADSCGTLTQSPISVTASGGTWTSDLGSADTATTNTNGQITSVDHPETSGTDLSVTYDTVNKAQSITVAGNTKSYAYVSAGSSQTTTITDSSGATETYVVDTTNSTLTSYTDQNGHTTSYQYDSAGRMTRETYPEGNYTNWTYDGRGNVTEIRKVAKSGSGLADIVWTASYDASCSNSLKCNKPNYIIDERGNRTDFTYNATHGGVTKVQLPAATSGAPRGEIDYTYTALYSQTKNSSGVLVNTSTPTYKVTKVTSCATAATCAGSANETVITYAYNDPNLLMTSMTIAAGDGSASSQYKYTYRITGKLWQVDGPQAGTDDTTYYFDRRNSWHSSTGPWTSAVIYPDPDGSGSLPRPIVRKTYGSGDLVTKVERGTTTGTTAADVGSMTVLSTVDYSYDGNGNLVSQTVSAGGTTQSLQQFTYDTKNRLECAAVRMNPALFGSPPSSACSMSTTGSFGPDRITKYGYDSVNHITSVQTAYGTADVTTENQSYTSNGQVAYVVDGELNRTTYEYDGHDRTSKIRYPVSTKGANASSSTDYEQLTYDPNGNVLTKRKRSGLTLTYAYDTLNRLTSKIVPAKSGVPLADTRNVYYGYDLQGHPLYARFDSATGEGVSFAYNALGEMTSSTQAMDGVSRTLGYQYDAAGNRTRITYPDTGYISYTYDPLSRMSHYAWWNPANGNTTQFGHIDYNALGQRTDTTRASSSTTYGYDAIGRLTSLGQNFAGGTGNITQTFGYNPASQIASQTRDNDAYAWTDASNTTRSYTPNGLNQYSAVAGTNFTYDPSGSLTSDGTNTYTYDVENRLVSRSGGGSTASLRYDPLGRLYEVVGSTTGTTRFLYDGDSLVGEYDTSGTMLKRYAWGTRPDELLLQFQGSAMSCTGTTFAQPDERGSIIATADCWGNRQSINTYDEYGIPGSGNTGRFQYTGQAWLPELGMYYYKARMYSPTLGRFMQTDPIGYSDGMNWYNYVGSDPVNGVDPSGLLCTMSVHWEYAGAIDANTGQPIGSSDQWSITSVIPNDNCSMFGDSSRNSNKLGAGSGGSQQPGRAPQKEKKDSIDWDKLGQCLKDSTLNHYGLGAATAASGAAAIPIPKAIVPPYRVIGAETTNLLSVVGHFVEINVPRMLNSTNLFRVAGRANPYVFGALLAVDVGVISYDTYQCYNNGGK